MKYFDKKSEKLSWLYILAGIPIGALILWKNAGSFGAKEIIILAVALLVAIAMLYIIKLISNRK